MENSDPIRKNADPWCERISALVDGDLGSAGLTDAELTALLDTLDRDPQVARVWGDYHLVGEVLRGGAAAIVSRHDAAFVQGVFDAIAADPRPSVSQEDASRHAGPRVAPVSVPAPERASANDPVWRWKIVAGISVLGMASILGWHLVGARSALGGPQLARVQTVPAAGGMVMIRDPQLDALIAAHQEQGGNSALQTPAGFVRNAAFERPAP